MSDPGATAWSGDNDILPPAPRDAALQELIQTPHPAAIIFFRRSPPCPVTLPPGAVYSYSRVLL